MGGDFMMCPPPPEKPRACRHRRAWAIAAGAWLWCSECGAIRLVADSGSWPGWVRPGDADKAQERARRFDGRLVR